MELAIEEAAVTIQVLSVNGKRMPKTIYSQLQHRSLLDDDCTLRGKPWGYVVDPKCCHRSVQPHWHVLHELGGELCVWVVPKNLDDATFRLRNVVYKAAAAGAAFLDACVLENRRGRDDFFQGQILDLVRNDEVQATIEDLRVCRPCSREAAELLRVTRAGWSTRSAVEAAESALSAPGVHQGGSTA
ncbi:hypothetical protein [Kitasatospora sp. NPDC002965]|uniref:hypothetical protein n=1 Tax=Kitasatospora sp. NPDC002965 TaxID=3154775 RepID=UPI0033BDD256